LRRRDREREQSGCFRECRGRYRGQTTHSIQQRGSGSRTERAQAPARHDSELDRPVVGVAASGRPNSRKRVRTGPLLRISGAIPFRLGRRAARGRLGLAQSVPSSGGRGGGKALNVVGGKILVPPTGRALYYIANREKGV